MVIKMPEIFIILLLSMIIYWALTSPIFPLIAWIIVVASAYFWSGLSKFIRFLFFPGEILYATAQFTGAKLCGVPIIIYRALTRNPRVVFRLPLPYSVKKTLITFIFFPFMFGLGFFILFSILSELTYGIPRLIFWWLAVSSFLALPRFDDFKTLYYVLWVKDPITFLFILWTPIVFILNLIAFGGIAVFITLAYLLLIILLKPVFPEERVVMDVSDEELLGMIVGEES